MDSPGKPSDPLVVQGQPVAATMSAAPKSYKGADDAEAVVQGVPLIGDFEQWINPKPPTFKDGLPVYEILGTDAQIVQFPLRPGRAIMCFSGAMCFMSPGMKMQAQLAGLAKTFGRVAGGGSLFQLTYTNETDQDGYIACTPDYPGVVVPINMNECPAGKIVALRDSFLCGTYGLGNETSEVGAGFNPANSVGGFCCSGIDFIVQTVSNGEWSFLIAMGTVVQKRLEPGETILVDTDSVLCFEGSVTIDVKTVGGFLTCCCSGEGLFNTLMTGPGKIWLQSMSIDKMRRLFPPKIQQTGTGGGGDE